MTKYLSDVKIFHKTYGLPILDVPTIPDPTRVELRLSLIKEEVKELEAAYKAKDVVEAADALVDLLYVTNGAILEFGLTRKVFDDSYDFSSFYKESGQATPAITDQDININFMSVIISDLEAAIKDKHIGDIVECLTDMVEIVFIVALGFGLEPVFEKCHNEVQASNMSKLDAEGKPIYREDGKVLKGPNFFKPNLKQIIFPK